MTRVLKVFPVLSALLQGPTSLFRNKLQELTSWEFLDCSQDSGKVCACVCVCSKQRGVGEGEIQSTGNYLCIKKLKENIFQSN